jgi:hypothetical protein
MKQTFLLASAFALTTFTNASATNGEPETGNPATTPGSAAILLAPYTPISNYSLDLGLANTDGDTDWDPTSADAFNAKNRSYFELYFGWNNWRNADGQATQDPMNNLTTELDFWDSGTWGFGFGTRSRLGDGKLGIRYGLQFNWHFYQFAVKSTQIAKSTTQGSEGISFVDVPGQNYKKSTYRNTYLDLPILLDIDLRSNEYKGLTLAFGGYGGVRLGTSTKIKYTDAVGDDVKVETHDPNYTNLWRYGLMAQIGFGAFKVTGKMDLNTVFEQNDLTTPDYQAVSITLGWVMP